MENFFSYKNYRWMWLNLLALVAMSVVYVMVQPVGGRNGGTVVGYTLGGLATTGILYLMWYGIRKRSYAAARTTLKGCLAAHAWIGIALTMIVPLHCGFSFGANVHTLAYALMVLVIFSGAWGAVNYVDHAGDIKSHRGGGTVKKLLEQVQIISMDLSAMTKDKSDAFVALLQKVDFDFKPSIIKSLLGRMPRQIPKNEAAALLSKVPEKETAQGLQLISLVNKKRELATSVLNEIRVLTKLKIWLYVHLPLSFGLLAALGVHIFSVFYYW